MEAEWRRAAAYVVARDDRGRLLLTRFGAPGHPDDGRWTLPGGGMEWGEPPEATAHRELAEETGLTATLGPVLGVFSRWLAPDETPTGRAGHLVGIVYLADVGPGSLRTTFDGTTTAARWCTLAEAAALPHVELVDFVLARISAGAPAVPP